MQNTKQVRVLDRTNRKQKINGVKPYASIVYTLKCLTVHDATTVLLLQSVSGYLVLHADLERSAK